MQHAAESEPLLTSTSWSEHARRYNRRDGQALTLPMLQAAFEGHFFGHLDKIVNRQMDRPVDILCLCGGTGPELELLCERYDAAAIKVLFTDNADGMIQIAKESIASHAYEDRVKTQLMDAMVRAIVSSATSC